MTNTVKQPIFNIEKLYVRDISLEVPNAPVIFLEQGAPEVEIQINTKAVPLNENLFDAALKLSITAKLGEKAMFLVELEQAGIFRIENIPQADMEQVLPITCPNILFPYARELVSSIVTRAGFNPILLAPVNFEAIYLQKNQKKEEFALAQ